MCVSSGRSLRAGARLVLIQAHHRAGGGAGHLGVPGPAGGGDVQHPRARLVRDYRAARAVRQPSAEACATFSTPCSITSR